MTTADRDPELYRGLPGIIYVSPVSKSNMDQCHSQLFRISMWSRESTTPYRRAFQVFFQDRNITTLAEIVECIRVYIARTHYKCNESEVSKGDMHPILEPEQHLLKMPSAVQHELFIHYNLREDIFFMRFLANAEAIAAETLCIPPASAIEASANIQGTLLSPVPHSFIFFITSTVLFGLFLLNQVVHHNLRAFVSLRHPPPQPPPPSPPTNPGQPRNTTQSSISPAAFMVTKDFSIKRLRTYIMD